MSRYIDELQHIGERTGDIENWIDDAKKKMRDHDWQYVKQPRRLLRLLVSHINVSQRCGTPKDDYTNIDEWGAGE